MQFEKAEIHTVFPPFSNFHLEQNLSLSALADLFRASLNQKDLRYVPERKMWFHYEGGIWKADTGSLRAMKYCMELADLMYTFALEIRDEDKRKSYFSENLWLAAVDHATVNANETVTFTFKDGTEITEQM